MEMKWYTVYTKPQSEKKVLELLSKKKIECYCPLNNIVNRETNRKIKEEPLFKSYVFVRSNDKSLADIKKVSGILNFVYWLGKPVVVNDIEIENLKDFLEQHNNVRVEKTSVGYDSCSESYHTPFFQSYSETSSVNTEMLILLIPSLGYVVCAQIIKPRVRIISSDSFKKTKFIPYKFFTKVVELNSVIRSNW